MMINKFSSSGIGNFQITTTNASQAGEKGLPPFSPTPTTIVRNHSKNFGRQYEPIDMHDTNDQFVEFELPQKD